MKKIIYKNRLRRLRLSYKNIYREITRLKSWLQMYENGQRIALDYYNNTHLDSWLRLYKKECESVEIFAQKINVLTAELANIRKEYNSIIL